MDSRTQLTKNLLWCIAQHLSSRVECRGIAYKVNICTEDVPDSIKFYPDIQVYLDTHHRKQCHKLPVAEHVVRQHFCQDLLDTASKSFQIYSDKVIPGIYEYQPSIDSKRRRWVRIA